MALRFVAARGTVFGPLERATSRAESPQGPGRSGTPSLLPELSATASALTRAPGPQPHAVLRATGPRHWLQKVPPTRDHGGTVLASAASVRCRDPGEQGKAQVPVGMAAWQRLSLSWDLPAFGAVPLPNASLNVHLELWKPSFRSSKN